MKNVYLYILTLLILSCNDKQKAIEKNETKVDTFTKSKFTKSQEDSTEVVYQTESLIVIGNKSIDQTKIYSSSQKFEPFIHFSDFKVAIEENKKGKLNLSSNRQGKMFQTRISEAYSNKKVNFAGHYILVSWGCGSICNMGKIIDIKSGKIYDLPTSSLAYNFKADSRLLIVNPTDSTGYYDNCSYCKPKIYIFEESSKSFIQRNGELQ